MAGEAIARYSVLHKIPMLYYHIPILPSLHSVRGFQKSKMFPVVNTEPSLLTKSTAPLRSYIDFVVTSQLRASLLGKQLPYSLEALSALQPRLIGKTVKLANIAMNATKYEALNQLDEVTRKKNTDVLKAKVTWLSERAGHGYHRARVTLLDLPDLSEEVKIPTGQKVAFGQEIDVRILHNDPNELSLRLKYPPTGDVVKRAFKQ